MKNKILKLDLSKKIELYNSKYPFYKNKIIEIFGDYFQKILRKREELLTNEINIVYLETTIYNDNFNLKKIVRLVTADDYFSQILQHKIIEKTKDKSVKLISSEKKIANLELTEKFIKHRLQMIDRFLNILLINKQK